MACSPLDVLVVGGGLGGLATALALQTDGHKVRIADAAREFGEVGAGIHMTPNSTRLLIRWGVNMGRIMKTVPGRYHYIRWKDGKTIARVPLDNVVEAHGAPYYLVHRADLHGALIDAARNAGVQIFNHTSIVDYNFEVPSATAEDGTVYTADLIVSADGIKSIARPLLTRQRDSPRDTGDVAYRILISGDKLLADPMLAPLMSDPCATLWCGPGAHLVGYPLRDGEIYNLVGCANSYPNETTDQAWVLKGDNQQLCQRFATWEPRVQKLCALAGDFMKWRLCDLPPLTRWVHPSGKAVLLGDSCHPMLPYLAQGAAQAFEDAGVLRQCLAILDDDTVDLTTALKLYQHIRMPRASLVQAMTREHQRILHFTDGEEQQDRDRKFKINGPENPVFWGYDKRRQWLFGHDAEDIYNEDANWTLVMRRKAARNGNVTRGYYGRDMTEAEDFRIAPKL